MPAATAMAAPGFHLGRSAEAVDAVAKPAVIDAREPKLAVKVTNPAGLPGEITGWLNGVPATAQVPPRSGTVVLHWEGAAARDLPTGSANVKLILHSGEVAHDTEEVLARMTWRQYDEPPSPPVNEPPPPPFSEPPPPPVTEPPSVDTGELPVTGGEVRPYVILGGGMLGFGLSVLGLSWVLGRRSPNE